MTTTSSDTSANVGGPTNTNALLEKAMGFQKKVYVQTWGCQMNVADSERMLSLLSQRNYKKTDTPEDADLVLLNTCHIREKARHKVVSRLGELRDLKKHKPDTIVAVAGCVAQVEAKILAKEVPFIDIIFGPDRIDELPQMLENAVERYDVGSQNYGETLIVESKKAVSLKQTETESIDATDDSSLKKGPVINTTFTKDAYSIPIDVVPPWIDKDSHVISRFVNIIKGCNNFCTFCVVPFTRGREKSRAVDEVIAEAKYFVDSGVKEIFLLGQNVNSYGLDFLAADVQPKDGQMLEGRLPFADLLYKVAAIEGVDRIRFTTSNPHDFTPDLANAFRDLPKLCDSFHLPVQSGSNRILDRMNRQYTREQYLERVEWIRAARPNIAFSTDIIVGFPGETDEEFMETYDLVKQMKYSFIYAFKYSPRRGTAATRFKEQVPEKVMHERLLALQAMQKEETTRQNLAEIGQVREVLIAYKNPKEENTSYGRTYQGRLVKVYTPRDVVGHTLKVMISAANLTALEGSPI